MIHLFEDKRLDLSVCNFRLELLWVWIRVLLRDEEESRVAVAVTLFYQLVALGGNDLNVHVLFKDITTRLTTWS